MKVDFYYDVVSPFSYLAYTIFCRYEKAWGLELELHPFLLGGVMKATGNTPPASLPARAPYLLRDLLRQCDFHHLPIQIPDSFPTNSLLAMRFLTATKQECPEKLRSFSEHLWQSHYGQGLEIATESALSQVFASPAFDPALIARLMQMSVTPEVKNALRAETEAAVEKGAFGAPTFFIHTPHGEEMFFGSDRFHLVAQLLGQKFP